jgi:hypothetical protein
VSKSPYYKLDEAGEPVPCENILEWAAWFAQSHEARVVVKTELPSGTTVSTVFLGIDHGFHGGDPVLWETMMFGGAYDLACDRYRSRKDAIVGHEVWVLVAKGEMTPIDARRLKAGFSTSTSAGQSREKKKKEQA